jgi:hypothetical protein
MKNLALFLSLICLPLLSHAQYTEYDVRKMVRESSEDQLVTDCSRMLQDNYFFFSETVWRLQFETIRRTKRLLSTFIFYLRGELFGKFTNLKLKILNEKF